MSGDSQWPDDYVSNQRKKGGAYETATQRRFARFCLPFVAFFTFFSKLLKDPILLNLGEISQHGKGKQK